MIDSAKLNDIIQIDIKDKGGGFIDTGASNTDIINLNYFKNNKSQIKKVMLMYESALKEMETRVKVLSDEFQVLHKYNPIEHIKTRIKTPESICKKLAKKGYEVNCKNLIEQLDDIAGIRIICSFIPDIYNLVSMIENSPDINVLCKKDYITSPKESGYSSYHLIVSVPVNFSSGIVNVKVEIQIRTMAMDFWASLEHKIKYKYSSIVPDEISNELKECSKMINVLDRKMSLLGNNLVEELEHDLAQNKDIIDNSAIQKTLLSSSAMIMN